MNQLTYHHYGASVIRAPINQLRRDLQAVLHVPADALCAARHTTEALEEVTDCRSGTRVLTCRSTVAVPEFAEYRAVYTLTSQADTPHTTLVEWTREYRPATPTDHDRTRAFVSALVEQDRAIASRLAAEYENSEVFYIDYTLGGA
jgi:hypothetical protein